MKHVLYLSAAATIFFASCGSEPEEKAEETVMKPAPIALTEVKGSPDFKDAKIALGEVKAENSGDSSKVTFNFNVENYDLMSQTADASTKMCNNSAKGQHIHFIMDNQPYAALYEPNHTVTLAKNTEHYLMAFLSRSYHESVKSEGAALVYHFKIDENGKVQKMDDPTTPMVFYSRPKGDYVGEADISNLLLDFYVWNAGLSGNDHQVRAHIEANGVDTTMVITDWKPYFLQNVPVGRPKITLTLADKDGNKVDGPMTEVTREFGVSMDEPLAQ